MKFFGWQPAAAQDFQEPKASHARSQTERLDALLECRDKLIERFCSNCEDIIVREPSFEESVTVMSHLFPNQLLTADTVSPNTSFTEQGRCAAVNKRGKRQCANRSMNGSRFCRTHHHITSFE